jgi:hypothetical protein
VATLSLGAMTYWAFTIHGNGLRVSTVRLSPLQGGVANTHVLAFVFSMSRSSEYTHHTFDRQVVATHSDFRTNHRVTRQLTLRVLPSTTTRLPRQILPAREASNRRSWLQRAVHDRFVFHSEFGDS